MVGNGVRDAAIFIGHFGAEECPFARRRILHNVHVHLLAVQRDHVQRSVHESCIQSLLASLLHDDIVGPMIGRHILELDGCALLDPLLTRLSRMERSVVLVIVGAHKRYALEFANLTQYEGNHIGTLPVAGMEQMRQSMCRKIAQPLGTIKSVIQTLCAPPFVLNCNANGIEIS